MAILPKLIVIYFLSFAMKDYFFYDDYDYFVSEATHYDIVVVFVTLMKRYLNIVKFFSSFGFP